MHRIFALIVVLIVAASPVAAQPPSDVRSIIQKMKEAFEPVRPSTRTLTLTVSELGDTQKFVAGQARKQLPDGKRMATVVLQPDYLRGTAFLASEPNDATKPTVVWIYIPAIRRVRKVLPIDAFEHFLGTDFTYADLGFVRQHKKYRLLATEQHAGTKAYKVEEKLPADQYYYSRIVMWIGQNKMLPLERDYYDPTGMLWKREVFDSVTTIDGAPTVLHVQMTDLEANSSTNMNVSQVQYDAQVSDSFFDPQHLPQLADDPVWKAGTAKP